MKRERRTTDLVEQLMHILILKRQPSTKHHIKNNPTTPNINLRPSIHAPSNDLWRSIIRTPTTRPQKIPIANLVGQAEISNLDVQVVIQQDVFGFEIAVDDFEPVRVFDARDDLLEEFASAGFGHAAVGDDVVEEFASGVFEDEDDVGGG